MNLSSSYTDEFKIYQLLFPGVPNEPTESWPSPIGLTLGIGAVVIGQIAILCYFTLFLNFKSNLLSIQKEGPPTYNYWKEMIGHLSQPEGFIMLGAYLCGTWMLKLMPASYYSFQGGINWVHVALQLLIQDSTQYLMHYLEHKVSAEFYRMSHKPHHRFTNPKLFDAFNGSPADTFCMILAPLFLTANLINANVWSYMAFGTLYANWLCLIHAEYRHPWDGLFRLVGFGTAADHHVHHKLFVYNYGHLFM
jgi:lathosterol oxidase